VTLTLAPKACLEELLEGSPKARIVASKAPAGETALTLYAIIDN